MKWIRYNVLQNTINVGTESKPVYEDILLEKKIGYCAENLIIAQNEAYKGEYTIEEDGGVLNVGVYTPWAYSSYLAFVGNVNPDMVAAAFGKGNESNIKGVGAALALYANSKNEINNTNYLFDYDSYEALVNAYKVELINTSSIYNLISSSPYAFNILKNAVVGLPDIVLYNKGTTSYLDISKASVYSYKSDTYSPSEYEYTLDTNSNLSVTKKLYATTYRMVFSYTMPLLKSLPNLKGYRYLNVKLANNEVSSLPYGGGNDAKVNLSIGGIDATFVQESTASAGKPEVITGKTYKVDLFSDYANDPVANDVILSIYMSTQQRGASNDTDKAVLNLHIDKIWISEN